MSTFDLISLDPGKLWLAYGAFEGEELQSFGVINPTEDPHIRGFALRADRVVWEIPQADGRGAPVEDLLAVCAVGADVARRIAERYGRVQAFQPRKWKGSLPKPVHHGRLWKILSKRERALLGGTKTEKAIDRACVRGAKDKWKKSGKLYYSAREFPMVNGIKITHDILDAVALGAHVLRRLK